MPDDTVALTMTPAAAEKFYAALMWAEAVAYNRAEDHEPENPERAAIFNEHAEWLRWGFSRLRAAREAQRVASTGGRDA